MSVVRRVPYRPWGRLEWLLPRLKQPSWSLLGSLSPEERSLTTWSQLSSSGILSSYRMLSVTPEPARTPELRPLAEQWGTRWHELYALRLAAFRASGGDPDAISALGLSDEAYKIRLTYEAFRASSGNSVVLDISSMPKRFFFPLLRFLIRDSSIENLVVVYTVAGTYSDDLTADAQEWDNLPTYVNANPAWSPRQLVVGIGHQPLGLPTLWSGLSQQALALRLMMPLPPGPPHVAKNWRFIHSLVGESNPNRCRVVAVDARDVSSAFTLIAGFGESGVGDLMLAPYGPKPISLAMAVYALVADLPVFYNQPNLYNPEYCLGVGRAHGHELNYGYCLRLAGRDLFQL